MKIKYIILSLLLIGSVIRPSASQGGGAEKPLEYKEEGDSYRRFLSKRMTGKVTSKDQVFQLFSLSQELEKLEALEVRTDLVNREGSLPVSNLEIKMSKDLAKERLSEYCRALGIVDRTVGHFKFIALLNYSEEMQYFLKL